MGNSKKMIINSLKCDLVPKLIKTLILYLTVNLALNLNDTLAISVTLIFNQNKTITITINHNHKISSYEQIFDFVILKLVDCKLVSRNQPKLNPQAPVAQKTADEVVFRHFQGEGVEFFHLGPH